MCENRHYQAKLGQPAQRAEQRARRNPPPRQHERLVVAGKVELGAGGAVEAVGKGAHARERKARRERRLQLLDRLGTAEPQHGAVVELAHKGEARRVVHGTAGLLGGAREALERHRAGATGRNRGGGQTTQSCSAARLFRLRRRVGAR